MAYLDNDSVRKIGFRTIGENVKISSNAVFYNPERIDIGNNVRIDDFCTISACENGYVTIGNNVHIASYCYVEAPAGMVFSDFSGLAARCTVYGGSDDYSGEYLTNPTVPLELRRSIAETVYLGKHVVVGTCSVILPGAIIEDGSAIGAMSMVRGLIPANKIAVGSPARVVKDRSKKVFELEDLIKKSDG